MTAAPQTTPYSEADRETGFSDWIDRELVNHATSRKQIEEQDLNLLLELRDLISNHETMEPASVISEFFRLRSRLQRNFYLLCYRLRNWLNLFYEMEISDPLALNNPAVEPLDLRFQSFARLISVARHQYFETAQVPVSFGDIRVRVCRRPQTVSE